MVRIPTIKIIDITQLPQYKRLLVRCIFHGQQDRSLEDICKFNKERVQYLERVIPLGFHM